MKSIFTISNQGLVDDGIYGYELKSDYSFIRYGLDPLNRSFHLYVIMTPKLEDRNKGYAKELLNYFFQIVKENKGVLYPGPYTTSGETYIKHVIEERMAKEYKVRLLYD